MQGRTSLKPCDSVFNRLVVQRNVARECDTGTLNAEAAGYNISNDTEKHLRRQ